MLPELDVNWKIKEIEIKDQSVLNLKRPLISIIILTTNVSVLQNLEKVLLCFSNSCDLFSEMQMKENSSFGIARNSIPSCKREFSISRGESSEFS